MIDLKNRKNQFFDFVIDSERLNIKNIEFLCKQIIMIYSKTYLLNTMMRTSSSFLCEANCCELFKDLPSY